MLLLKRGPPMAFAALAVSAALVGTWELYAMARRAGGRPHQMAGLLGALSIGLAFAGLLPPLAALGMVAGLSLLSALWRRDVSAQALGDVSATLCGAMLVPGLLGFLVSIRALEAGKGLDGDLVLLILVATWASDGAAYYVGRSLGRHKMAPTISPGKTWEGAAGGVLGAAFGALTYRAAFSVAVPVAVALVVAAAVAILGPAGDLCESILKRSAGVKDSSALIPGHGGILDRVDSLLFTAPVLYYYYCLALGRP